MKKESRFPIERARRVTPAENQKFREAIADQFGIELRDREKSVQSDSEEYELVAIKIHPKALAWAKKEAQRRGIAYQTVINETLLTQIDS